MKTLTSGNQKSSGFLIDHHLIIESIDIFQTFFVKYKDKFNKTRVMVIEIKPKNQVTMPEQNPKRRTPSWAYKVQTWVVNQAKWEAAKEFCADHNYEFKVMTEEDLGI